VTTLIVARPVILGEDPGMLADLTDSTNTVMTLLWLVTPAVWVAYRLMAPRDEHRSRWGWSVGAFVEVGLLVMAGLVILSAFIDTPTRHIYRHPARLIAWEWVALFAAFFVVRRVSIGPAEAHGLFTALLATGVAVSAYTIWQTAVEMPRLKKQVFSDRTATQQALAREGVMQEADEAFQDQLRKRAEEGHAFGTFAHPNSLAGYLILLLPGLVGAALRLRWSPAPTWQIVLAGGAALVGVVGLWLTHSRGALLAGLLVGLAIGGHAVRDVLLRHKLVFLAVVAGIAAAGYGVFATGIWDRVLGKDPGTVSQRVYYWTATATIIREHPWLGVGPGNFATAYTPIMDPRAGETIKDPHNFLLEIWATSGLFAVLALLATLALFFVPAIRALIRPVPSPTQPPSTPERQGPAPLRWEYYVGGMIGILLGFILRAGDQPSSELLWEAVAAGIRAVVWFGAFGLLELVPWTARSRALVLTAGAAALLLNLCVSGGIGFPSVAGPLWAVIALGCSALPSLGTEPSAEQATNATPVLRVLELLPLPVFLALALAYVTYVLDPVTNAMAKVRQANDNGRELAKRGRAVADPVGSIRRQVLQPLKEAARLDGDNARIRALLAGWYGRLWAMEEMAARGDTPQTVEGMKEAMKQALLARQLDPHGREGYFAEYQLRDQHFGATLDLLAAKLLESAAKDEARAADLRKAARNYRRGAQDQYHNAARALLDFESYDPTDPTLHYLIAAALDKAGETEAAQKQAQTALDLDALQGSHSTRRLTSQQHQALAKLLEKAPAS
jgi:O-antigen ligase